MSEYDLLIIDPQNDFLDIEGAALPVPGANADMHRLADWLTQHAEQVRQITVTLDSHASVGVERTTFWQQADGSDVAAFTLITAAQVQQGVYRPRHAALTDEVISYLQALETTGQRQLIVWPVHCVLGTWGHNIHSGLSEAIAAWELSTGRVCHKVLKGQNPLTEQYSAFKAEVPRPDDERTLLNRPLMQALSAQGATLLVAGEALSHCVAASVTDLMQELPVERLRQTVLLTDCMSPVSGFETAGADFLEGARAAGLQTRSLVELA
ncbi:cysteine hydrolase [Rhodoferax mekongensis]|uniref:cysteine hydrolase n=1 Tax=Rhodoferax mekongensis TaxID=3068341 RepID=UPI0028BDC4F0|nr:cysteine hydrolase [Rhodoferax sp. TBRC 17199]MDT7514981.1 isochorismatase family protein [Rhodoferax sp. TBRC 17199]